MLEKTIRAILYIWNNLAKIVIYFMTSTCSTNDWKPEEDVKFQEYKAFVEENRGVVYRMQCIARDFHRDYKWVGGQQYQNKLYGVPNGDNHFLIIDLDTEEIQLKGDIKEGQFKWTGGTAYNDKIFGFPRTENSFIVYDMMGDTIEEKELDIQYTREHHYSGVCTEDGIVYQPPRNTDHILVTDLNCMKSKKIQIFHPSLHVKDRYCGSIKHPNGKVYFFPEKRGKVIKFDLKTEKWEFIGGIISTMVFDAKVAENGDIYGYSAYLPGILHIDVLNNVCEMIHREISPGAYGTKLGINGKLYSIPGDGERVWEYDVREDRLRTVGVLKSEERAKYAGGITAENGCIWGVPAYATEGVLKLVPSKEKGSVPESIFKQFYSDNY